MKRRFISFVTLMCLLVTLSSSAFSTQALLGDANGDGKVAAADARLILRHSLQLEIIADEYLPLCDINKDGAVTVIDARLALRLYARLENVDCIIEGHSLEENVIDATETQLAYSVKVCTRENCSYREIIGGNFEVGNIPYYGDTASWELICVNRYRRVSAESLSQINLVKVAGSGELMDHRAASAYNDMYAAARLDGIYLTPCSGYRSYERQERLFNEFYRSYLNQGYSEADAFDLTSRRRNPAGGSEHNLGICMDIICASSAANFQNTKAYAWLCENAHKYGFILRYPEDKTDITGVKFEPWHWRYVGASNALLIKNSGLCLEEYLGLA